MRISYRAGRQWHGGGVWSRDLGEYFGPRLANSRRNAAAAENCSHNSRYMRERARRAVSDLLGVGAFALPLIVLTWLDDPWVLPKTVAMLGISIALAVAVVLATPRRQWRVPTTTEFRRVGLAGAALIAYLALNAAATIASADPVRSIIGHQEQYQGLAATSAYAVAFVAAAAVLTGPERLRGFVNVVVAVATIVATYGILQQIGIDPLWRGLYGGMIFSTFGEHTS